MTTILGQGAEATLYHKEDKVVKTRHSKSYRHPKIDEQLRKFRTRREAKVLERLCAIGFPAPRLQKIDDKNMEVHMDFVSGKKVRDILSPEIAAEIGRKIGILHKHNIIHGDLTTSNMIYGKEVYFIDFGLSFFSSKAEDKAVDLHLLRCALESKHWMMYEKCFHAAVEGYKETYPEHSAVLERMEIVEARGRNKHKFAVTF